MDWTFKPKLNSNYKEVTPKLLENSDDKDSKQTNTQL